MKDQEIQKKGVEVPKLIKTKRSFEISEEAQENRRLLEAFLLNKVEELTVQRNLRQRQIEHEEIELRGGKVITRSQIIQFVTASKRVYSAIFPNENRFFANMFRLHPKLIDHDPQKYEKPYLAGKLLKLLTYDRFKIEFSAEVLPTLVVFAMPGGIRLFKCHEFLTDDGVKHMIRFRDDANKMMDKYGDLQWYDFIKEYSREYKLVFQPHLF
jgi:hypothetical protein